MHGLKIYTGNHMEILAEQLARIVREPLSVSVCSGNYRCSEQGYGTLGLSGARPT